MRPRHLPCQQGPTDRQANLSLTPPVVMLEYIPGEGRGRGAVHHYASSLRPQRPPRLRYGTVAMAISQRKHTSILLTFKVLQFVNQLRRRVKPRVCEGSSSDSPTLGTEPALGLRRLRTLSTRRSRISIRNARHSRRTANRVCNSRQRDLKEFRTSRKVHAPGWDVSATGNIAGDEVQQYVRRCSREVSSAKLSS